MKPVVYLILCFSVLSAHAQITTPQIKANFGVDADLRANYFNNFVQSGNDDWFLLPGTPGTGQFVIDTTGAASILARYGTDLNFRKLPFFRTMRFPQYSIVNNRTLIDAVFIRDYHGDDSTVFASGASKNGMSPADWSCPIAQSIPDKNDILDMFVHVRREGPNSTYPLWLFGGVSIENTTGDRYFDFEMYQTDIYYDRASQKFYGYGPDAGHTSWKFDAGGNVTQPGDIIFSADYGSSTLTSIEARIWIDKADLAITPAGFDWSGTFDGATTGSQFGYAGIRPKTVGAFYTGMESGNNTWAGPFGLIRENNSLVTNYTASQFMEFSVNLTFLGLDPVTLLGGNACGMPFRRVLVKTRASTSFTAALKDFIGPFDFFLAPRATAAADIPILCATSGISTIQVTNPVPTSSYTWSTPDGHIVSADTGSTIQVDMQGTYIVTQRLQSGCSIYAMDTVTILYDVNCGLLTGNLTNFSGIIKDHVTDLSWTVTQNQDIGYFEVERSLDGEHFRSAGRVNARSGSNTAYYKFGDNITGVGAPELYYRLKIVSPSGEIHYSSVIRLWTTNNNSFQVIATPNPVQDQLRVQLASAHAGQLRLSVFDVTGRLMCKRNLQVQAGTTTLSLADVSHWPRGLYCIQAALDDEVETIKINLTK